MLAVDYAYPRLRAWLSEVKDLGYSAVIRYYDNGEKMLLAEEAQEILAEGLQIFTVFETWGGAGAFEPSGDAYFTSTMASRDATKAVEAANAAGQPYGHPFEINPATGLLDGQSVIFFAVDYNCADPNVLTEYFNTVYSILHPAGYIMGVYGSYRVTVFAGRHWPGAPARWQTYAWSGGLIDAGAHIYQYSNGEVVAGSLVDLNIVDIQGWGMDYITREEFQRHLEDDNNTANAIKAVLAEMANDDRADDAKLDDLLQKLRGV